MTPKVVQAGRIIFL